MSTDPARDARVAPYGALALHLAVGVVFLAHALSKPLVFTLPGTAAFFERHGFPGWSAYPVFALELLGGMLLLSGVGSRWAADGRGHVEALSSALGAFGTARAVGHDPERRRPLPLRIEVPFLESNHGRDLTRFHETLTMIRENANSRNEAFYRRNEPKW